MNILVIGSGGREHALIWKLRQSGSVSKLWCVPGNGGILQDAECLAGDPSDVAGLAQIASKCGADLTIVGPEQPLVLGIQDEFERRGLRVLGPSAKGAQLEGSKIFAKQFLLRHNIPTASVLGICDSAQDAYRIAASLVYPAVLKADGLCGGKGVLVAKNATEASSFVRRALETSEFGAGGSRLLFEEALTGSELSFIVLANGRQFVPLAPTRDHKRVFDNDEGPNTGGMGAYSTDDIVSPEMYRTIVDKIVRPTLQALSDDGCDYNGFLYFGLMLTAQGPKVLEFNCRLGDPETQPIMARADFDLAELLNAAVDGDLGKVPVKWSAGASLCVVMCSGGYPGKHEVGKEIRGLEEAARVEGVSVFHAGTKREGAHYYTSSGRVLGVTARGVNLLEARSRAYEAAGKIRFEGAHYRRDIASRALTAATPGD